ncbi:hypothetical protein [Acinetobacter sp. WZC-1]|uniref:hypothetical protein n=1 Tax=Acinetobacter sp. WZC-1 TaxID=3459034 RepID=UPI00403DBF53
MKKKSRSKRSPFQSMENEVIIAVIILYLVIVAVMVVVHYGQPSDQKTETSSTSVSHTKH